MTTVREVMEPDVFWLAEDTPLRRAAEMLTERQVSGAPAIAADGKIVGMFTKTELAEFYGASHEKRLVRDVMRPGILAVAPDEPLEHAIEVMAIEGVHRLLVLDGNHLAGIVTSMDVLRALAGLPRRGLRVVTVRRGHRVGSGAPRRLRGTPHRQSKARPQ